MNYKSYQNLSDDIKNNYNKIGKYKIDLVVGIPRSGMIPAYMIALLLNVDCTDFNSFIENRPLVKGGRILKANNSLPHDYDNILLVDDSIFSGRAMKEIKAAIPDRLKSKIVTTAIYSSESKRNDVDFFFLYLPPPRVFEWNIFHVHTLSKSCVDIDGVLCAVPANEENDDGENYINFLKNAVPYILPTHKIHTLITYRLEKYRSETETWLKRNGITYDNLIMLDLPGQGDRQKLEIHAKHKASYYKNSDTLLFIESSFFQAQKISLLSGKDVYCTETNTIVTANALNIIKNNPKGLKKYIPRNIKKSVFFVLNFLKAKKKSLLPN